MKPGDFLKRGGATATVTPGAALIERNATMNHFALSPIRPPRQTWLKLLGGLGVACCLATASLAADAMNPLNLSDVQVGGEIGRRITVTITNNLLALDTDRDFLPPFKAKTAKDGYIGLGKLIGATVKFAANTGDARVIALKQHLVEETVSWCPRRNAPGLRWHGVWR